MNAKQLARIELLTNRITQAARLRDDSWLNGPIVFHVEEDVTGIWLHASNATDELRWFETLTHVSLRIGKAGGAKLYSTPIGISIGSLGGVTTNSIRKH